MKRNKISVAVFILITSFAFIAGFPEPRNPPLGKTGAPNESTCGESGCHSGGTYAAKIELAGLPDTISANTTYNFRLVINAAAVRSGFQITQIDADGNSVGVFNPTGGVNIASLGTRSYARQSRAVDFNGDSVSYNLSWTSPASIKNNVLDFYFIGMCGNGDNKKSGDNSVTSRKRVVMRNVSSDISVDFAKLNIMYNPNDKTIVIKGLDDLNLNFAYNLSIVNMAGQALMNLKDKSLTSQFSVGELPAGNYIVKINAANSAAGLSKKIIIY